MREKGGTEAEVLNYLAERQTEDLPFERILSSMCTRPHPIAVKAHLLFMHTNLGDPGLYRGTAGLERLLIERIGTLLHFPEACGYATSGGTESNIQALRIAQRMKKVRKPNVIVPESVHFSFEKACGMLGIRIREIPLDARFRADADAIPDLIDRNTIALVAVAGTTEYGMVDPVPAMDAIAGDHGLYFHVDAAFGGFVLPFLPRHVPFDFALPHVNSISVDPHKMGMATIPTGCLLVREPQHLSSLNICTPYLSVRQEFTLTGTRPGGSVAGALAVLDHLGKEGMRAVVEGCMKNTRRLIDGMSTYGYPPAVVPDVNVATFSCGDTPLNWQVSRTRRGHLRIVCMPHVHRGIIEAFLADIGNQSRPPKGGP